MKNRWLILVVLFLVRLAMAFQFQSIGALSPVIAKAYAIGLADIGLLIGLYLAPGVIVSIPGGAIAARFGDKRVVGISICLMLVGAMLISLSTGWNTLVAGRIISGVGGVVLNIVMTKMLVDWFAGKEISTALAIFLNSWPVGIALALLILPWAAQFGGLAFVWWAITGLMAASLVVFTALYAPPRSSQTSVPLIQTTKLPVYTLTLAALIWALYNTALSMVFSFGPALFVQKGWSLADAGSAISAFMIAFSIFVPFGGVLADRTGARDGVIALSLISFVALIPVVLYGPGGLLMPSFIITAGLFALAAGPIMSLPSVVLAPEARAFGMGVFFTINYAAMMVTPRIVGAAADNLGDAGIAFVTGAVMSLICAIALWVFRRALKNETPPAFAGGV